MRVLFISSGNNKNFEIIPFIKRQADSIEKIGCQVSFFKISGKGIKGYFKNVKRLKDYLKSNNFDLIHAHYTFNGLVALLTFTKLPIVVSYMGTDTYGEYNTQGGKVFKSNINILISKVIQPFIKKIIVKSPNLEKYIYLKKKVRIIPNGIDLNYFKVADKISARNKLNLPHNDNIILFLGNKKNPRKNFTLIEEAIKNCKTNINVLAPFPIKPDNIIDYYNAADAIVLSSFNEGSPNIIKEAMACNKPIVSTNVGDVNWLFNNLAGCYISTFNPCDFATKIEKAIEFSKSNSNTQGRNKLIDLGLDSESIAKRIVSIYQTALKS